MMLAELFKGKSMGAHRGETDQVPSSLVLFNCFSSTQIYYILTYLIVITNQIECKHHHHHHHHHGIHKRHQLQQPSWPESSLQDASTIFETTQSQANLLPISSQSEPTPELNLATREESQQQAHQELRNLISPTKVFEEHQVQDNGFNGLASPIFDLRSLNLDQQLQQQRNINGPNLPVDNNNNNFLEFSESGSGDSPPFDDTPVKNDETASVQPDQKSDSIWQLPSVSTQKLDQQSIQPMPDDRFDRAPVLVRRIPKLVALAGQFWRYTIPADTFADEDGDLRKLRTLLVNPLLQLNSSEDKSIAQTDSSSAKLQSQYLHWLQYDQNSQTLYGFPMDDDAGRYEYNLMVVDRWNLTNNEVIEITIRQHQSARAFTHSFQINDILWNTQKYPSMIIGLLEFTNRINLGLQLDFSTTAILKSYNFRRIQQITGSADNSSQSDGLSLMTIEWSNATIPIHPCDLTKLEQISRFFVDASYPNWSLVTGQRTGLIPSQSLIKALEPDFRPSSVDIKLLGACEHNESPDDNSSQLTDRPKVRTKIGKLNWKLGEPIMYKIPDEVFEADGGTRDSRNLSLTLHTIDGLNLEASSQFNFLEFDRENRIVFGLPYDSVQHTGAKELLLTATHPISNQTAREVFVINIERQDLTTINNMAFQVSLYFMVRSTLFGPRQRVTLGQFIAKSLGQDGLEFAHDQDIPQLTVIDIQKFSFFKYKSDTAVAYIPSIWNEAAKFQLVKDETNNAHNGQSDILIEGHGSMSPQTTNFLYKLIWTNESIGHDGNCPVEVIKVNILEALERTMLYYSPELDSSRAEDSKNDSMKFYERLRSFFEPDLDLVHLRFEPLNACHDKLEVHDAGSEKFADMIESIAQIPLQEYNDENLTVASAPPKIDAPEGSFNSDEYWSIVVLVVLVVALIFVIMMFFMGMHTYKINQEKKFELQVKLAQARQNSMFYSSLMLADQAANINGYIRQPSAQLNSTKQTLNHHDESDRSARRPVILDNEKQYQKNGAINAPIFSQVATNYNGQTVQTIPLRPNMTFTLDSIASTVQNPAFNAMFAQDPMRPANVDEGWRSMTLNRRQTNMNHQAERYLPRHTSMNRINHSQSILTVASLTTPLQILPHSQATVPIMYTPLPVVCESTYEISRDST